MALKSTLEFWPLVFLPEKKERKTVSKRKRACADCVRSTEGVGDGVCVRGRGADRARLLWKVFPYISCSPVRALPRVTNR